MPTDSKEPKILFYYLAQHSLHINFIIVDGYAHIVIIIILLLYLACLLSKYKVNAHLCIIALLSAPTSHVRKGSGDIVTDSWFCKLTNYVIFFLALEHTMSGTQEQMFNVPRSFSLSEGSRNKINVMKLTTIRSSKNLTPKVTLAILFQQRHSCRNCK